jgi:hypothetical protein
LPYFWLLDFALFEYVVDVRFVFFLNVALYPLSRLILDRLTIYFDPVAILDNSRNTWLMKSTSLFVLLILGIDLALSLVL